MHQGGGKFKVVLYARHLTRKLSGLDSAGALKHGVLNDIYI